MKKLLMLIIGILMMVSLNSCGVYSYATTQDDIYVEAEADVVYTNVDFGVVIRYGTPYYYNGDLLYYIYNGLYYYPFYYDNYWYVRVYRRPFSHLYHRPYFRPRHYDMRFEPGRHPGFDNSPRPRPHDNRFGQGRRPDNRPNDRVGRPEPRRNDIGTPQRNRPETRSNSGQPQRQGTFGGNRQTTQPRPQTTQPRPQTTQPRPQTAQPRSSGVSPSPATRQAAPSGGGGRFGGRR